MKNQKIVGVIVIVILVAGISFWGGMAYAKNKSVVSLASRQNSFAQNGGARGGAGMRVGAGGGLVSGKVLSVDANSMTVELGNGGAQSGSKIVLFSPTTKVEKTVSGAVTDVAVGSQVTITGTANGDGSVSATSIQLRPITVGAVPNKQ